MSDVSDREGYPTSTPTRKRSRRRRGDSGESDSSSTRGAAAISRVRGLKNVGNSCYANAALQCILSVPLLADAIRKAKDAGRELRCSSLADARAPSETLLTRLQRLQEKLSTTSSLWVNPEKFIRCAQECFSDIDVGTQEDSAEFANYLLEKLHYVFDPHVQFEQQITTRNIVPPGASAAYRECACKCSSARTEDATILALEIKKTEDSDHHLLTDLFHNYFASETLSADNTWRECEHRVCRAVRAQQKRTQGDTEVSRRKISMSTGAPVMIIRLKRFKYHDEGGVTEKISDAVSAPLSLDMSPYFVTPDEAHANYSLRAFVEHRGATVQGGHYVAFVKDVAGVWRECDDRTVSVVTDDEVSRHAQSAYMLFYERRDGAR